MRWPIDWLSLSIAIGIGLFPSFPFHPLSLCSHKPNSWPIVPPRGGGTKSCSRKREAGNTHRKNPPPWRRNLKYIFSVSIYRIARSSLALRGKKLFFSEAKKTFFLVFLRGCNVWRGGFISFFAFYLEVKAWEGVGKRMMRGF